MDAFSKLVEITARLRGEGGCPWDREQTPASMRPYLLEETYEVLDALDRDDWGDLEKELGDLIFQVVMLSRMAEERGAFDIERVLDGVSEKMVRRHPHVFDPSHDIQGDEGDVSSWEARKAAQRSADVSALQGVPKSLPALLRAHRISEKASRVGFDWPDLVGVRAKLDEEIEELDEALADGEEHAITHELGDVLLSLVNLGRFLPTGSEEALRLATNRFEGRFRSLESRLVSEGRTVHETDVETLDTYWKRAKQEQK